MHREIMKPPKGKVVDHISGNKLDNTRANLRNITQGQNMHNKAKCFGSTSIYKGVYLRREATPMAGAHLLRQQESLPWALRQRGGGGAGV